MNKQKLDASHVFIVVGLIAVFYGIWNISPTLFWIALGLYLILVAAAYDRRKES